MNVQPLPGVLTSSEKLVEAGEIVSDTAASTCAGTVASAAARNVSVDRRRMRLIRCAVYGHRIEECPIRWDRRIPNYWAVKVIVMVVFAVLATCGCTPT